MFKQSIIDYPNENELKHYFISVLMTGLAAVKLSQPLGIPFFLSVTQCFT